MVYVLSVIELFYPDYSVIPERNIIIYMQGRIQISVSYYVDSCLHIFM